MLLIIVPSWDKPLLNARVPEKYADLRQLNLTLEQVGARLYSLPYNRKYAIIRDDQIPVASGWETLCVSSERTGDMRFNVQVDPEEFYNFLDRDSNFRDMFIRYGWLGSLRDGKIVR